MILCPDPVAEAQAADLEAAPLVEAEAFQEEVASAAAPSAVVITEALSAADRITDLIIMARIFTDPFSAVAGDGAEDVTEAVAAQES